MSFPSTPSRPVGKQAIVTGASMAGLLAAAVLARHFERVTLVERDSLEEGPNPRKGVPQGFQLHVLIRHGVDIMAGLFPGLLEDLQAAGAHTLDVTGESRWYLGGAWLPQVPCGVPMTFQSRPLLEWTVRERVRALPNVHLLDGREVAGFQTRADRGRITGLRLRAPGSTEEELLEGDLVVDASGRGSRTPQWLEALGYPRVEEQQLRVDVGYASRHYRKPAGFEPGWKSLATSAHLPEKRRMGFLVPIEGDRWLVLLSGWLKDYPPVDEAGFLQYARELHEPHLYEAIRNAEPLGPPMPYRFPHNQWRHYERMARFPEGLAVVGDALCSFNPIYGQGITTAALQVQVLEECLGQGLGGLAGRYRQRAARVIQGPWLLSTSEDLRIPEVQGQRSRLMGVMQWYMGRFLRVAACDQEALRLFMQVLHLVKPPTALFTPRMLRKTLGRLPTDAELPPAPAPVAIPLEGTPRPRQMGT